MAKMKPLLLFIMLLLLLGCIKTLFDREDPKITFDNVINFEGSLKKIYKGNIIRISGRVYDNDNVDYLKQDEEFVQLEHGNFEVTVMESQAFTVFEARDEAGNKRSVDVELLKDVTYPTITNIRLNQKTYVENMSLGNIEEVLVEIFANDNIAIREVIYEGEVIELVENSYNFTFTDVIKGINTFKVTIVDYADNILEKEIIFDNDNLGPEINNIKIDNFNYKDYLVDGTPMKYGKGSIIISMNITDKSGLEEVRVNGNVITSYSFFPYVLNIGENEIEISAIDIYGNETIKNLKINYILGIPILENLKLTFNNEELIKREDIYYTKEIIVGIQSDMYSGDSQLRLKDVIIKDNEAEILKKDISGLNLLFNENISLLYKGLNNLDIVISNDSYVSSPFNVKVYKDITPPEINSDFEGDILYVTSDQAEIIDFTENLIITDDTGYINEVKFFIDNFEYDEDDTFPITDEQILKITATDIAGNEATKEFTIIKDKEAPYIRLMNLDYRQFVENYESGIVIIYKANDELEHNIQLTVLDDGSGLKSIKYGDTEIEENTGFNINLDSLKVIYLEDIAGNIKEIPIKRINIEEIKFKFGDLYGLESIYNSDTNEYYVGEQNVKADIKINSIGKVWTKVKPESLTSNFEIDLEDLKYGVNKITFYFEDDYGNSNKYVINVYYENIPPEIYDIQVEEAGVFKDYVKNKIIIADSLKIKFNVKDDSDVGIKEVRVEGDLITGTDGEYIYEKTDLENNTSYSITIEAEDNLGNKSSEIIKIIYQDLEPVEISVISLSYEYIMLSWTKPNYPYPFEYELYVKESGSEYNDAIFLSTNTYKVQSLKDNTVYSFKVRLRSIYFEGIDSNELSKITLNSPPRLTEINYFETYTDENFNYPYFKLKWNKVADEDAHDFKSYAISRSENGTVFDKVSYIEEDSSITEFVDQLDRTSNNKIFYYKVQVLDQGGLLSNAKAVYEYAYNLKPDITGLDFKIDSDDLDTIADENIDLSLKYGEEYSLKNTIKIKYSFSDISSLIDMDTYEVYRTFANGEDTSIPVLTCRVSGATVRMLSANTGVGNLAIEDGRIVFTETLLEEKSKYIYKIVVKDQNYNVNEVEDRDEKTELISSEIETIDLAPLNLINPSAILKNNEVLSLSWSKSENEIQKDFDRILIYRAPASNIADLSLVGLIDETSINPTGTEMYNDPYEINVFNDDTVNFNLIPLYYYKIGIYDKANNFAETSFEVDSDGVITNITLLPRVSN